MTTNTATKPTTGRKIDMREITLFLVTCLLVSPNLIFGQAELPSDAQSLANKLAQWEKKREAEYKKEIALKRQQVATALQAHLKSATTRGDLDGALAIKNFIKTLKIDAVSNGSVSNHSRQSDDLSASIANTSWTWFYSDQTFVFRVGGKAEIYSKSKPGNPQFHFTWKKVGNRSVEVERTDGFAKGTVTFNRSFKTASYSVERPTKKVTEIRRIEKPANGNN